MTFKMIMRLIYTFIFFILLVSPSIGQTFTLIELTKMVKMKEKDFMAIVKKKGFSLYKKRDDGDFEKSMTFILKESDSKWKSISWDSYMFGESVVVRFDTEEANDFKQIENQIYKLNLKMVGGTLIGKWENGIDYSVNTYKMNNYEVALWKEGAGFKILVSLMKK